jgi:beta-barrel assembly-enhancing protease
MPAAVWAVTLKEEIDLGQKIDQEVLKQTPLTTDTRALAEINEYGQNLVKNVNRKEIKYHFRIIKDDDLNAFAIPGGYVYFSERLWNVLRKDERIGVLAHEIVHVDRRHSLDAISKQQRRQIWLAVLLTAVKANQTWGDITGMLHNIYSLKYTRADERQADEIGVQLTQEAGYNPAGLLLAMRKINRFQSESGGQPPKIFSSHPPTPERLRYLQTMLTDMHVAVPPDNPVQEQVKYRIGDVTAVTGAKVQFVCSEALPQGQVLWLMTPGWDYYYEKHTAVPAARAVVTSQTGKIYVADITLLPKASASDIVKGIGVYDPPKPKPEKTAARLDAGSPGRIDAQPLKRLARFLARETVWNKEGTELVYDNTGYLVVTNPSSAAGYVAAARPEYKYAPLSAGADLVPTTNAVADRWLGPIVSIGRGGGTIELSTERDRTRLASDLNSGRRFDVLYPPWDPKDTYEERTVGTAVLKSLDGKIVLQMLSYTPGWDVSGLENGFDIYEQKPEK